MADDPSGAPTPAEGSQGTPSPSSDGSGGTPDVLTRDEASKLVHDAVKTHFGRFRAELPDILKGVLPKAGPPEQPYDNGKAPKGGQGDDEVAALRTRLQELESRDKARDEETRRSKRESDLKGKLASLKVPNVDAAFTYFKGLEALGRLKVNESGDYYGTDESGGFQSLDEFMVQSVKSHPGFRSPSGKEGGGGTTPGAPGSGEPTYDYSWKDWNAHIQKLMADNRMDEVQRLSQQLAAGKLKVEPQPQG